MTVRYTGVFPFGTVLQKFRQRGCQLVCRCAGASYASSSCQRQTMFARVTDKV